MAELNTLKNTINSRFASIDQDKEVIKSQINQTFEKEYSKNEDLNNLSFNDYKIKIDEYESLFYYSLWRNSYDVIASHSYIVDEINLYNKLWQDYSNNKFTSIEEIDNDDELNIKLEQIQDPRKLLNYLSNKIAKNFNEIKKTNDLLREDISISTQNIPQFENIENDINSFFSQIPNSTLQEMINYSKSNSSFSTQMLGQQLNPDGPTDGLNVHGGNRGYLHPEALKEAAAKLIEKASSKLRGGLDKLWGNGIPKTNAGRDLATLIKKINDSKDEAESGKEVNKKSVSDSVKRTDHAEQRHGERPDIDDQKVIREGDQYVQDDGRRVFVRGSHVVILNDEDIVVTKIKNHSASSTKGKVKDGRWKPVDKATGQTKEGSLNSIFDKIKKQKDCRTK